MYYEVRLVTTWPQGCMRTSLGLSRQTVHLVPVLSTCPARAVLSSCLSWAFSCWAFPAVSQAKTTRRAEINIINNSSNLLKTPGPWLELTVLVAAVPAPLESPIFNWGATHRPEGLSLHSIAPWWDNRQETNHHWDPEEIFHISAAPSSQAACLGQSLSVKQVERDRRHESSFVLSMIRILTYTYYYS